VEDQPDDRSRDEILPELAFIRMVDRGIEDADAGRVVPHEEVRRRVDTWPDNGALDIARRLSRSVNPEEKE